MFKNRRFIRCFLSIFTSTAMLIYGVSSHAIQVDVLVVYDDDTHSYYTGSPNTAIRNMVSQTNTYFSRSRVDIQLNLVGTKLININKTLADLRTNAEVIELRNTTGADFVTYIPGTFDGGCGIGYVTTRAAYAFNIVQRGCMSRSYAHEMGHNMGLGHSVAQNSSGSLYDYGIGYGVQSVFSTLMAYESAYGSPSRTFLLSNPDYLCSGYTCGEENIADAASALNNVKTIVAEHRQAAPSFVSMQKQNSSSFAIDGNKNGENAQDVYLWSFSPTNPNQHWEEIDRGDGYVSYKKRNTNFCLDGGSGGSDSQNVVLWACDVNDENQHWRKVDLGGKYRLEKRNAPDYSIDGGNGGANGQSIFLWRSSNVNANQQWIFSEQE